MEENFEHEESYYPFDSIVVNKIGPTHFHFEKIDDTTLVILATANDRVVLQDTVIEYIGTDYEFKDFNDDGNFEFSIAFGGNNIRYSRYLYDTTINIYKYIEGLEYYSFMQRVNDSNHFLYYTLDRVGCADKDWESDLLEIRNGKVLVYGRMFGNGCLDYESNEIEISKVIDSDQLYSMRKITYSEALQHHSSIPDFVGKYWNEKHSQFHD